MEVKAVIKVSMTIHEVADVFQVSDRMVKKWCEAGRIVALHTPANGEFPRPNLQTWKK
jgi:hypothetical protein